jgi:hypothetical protein
MKSHVQTETKIDLMTLRGLRLEQARPVRARAEEQP